MRNSLGVVGNVQYIVYSVQCAVCSVMHSSLCSYTLFIIKYSVAVCNELPCLRDHILTMGGASN